MASILTFKKLDGTQDQFKFNNLSSLLTFLDMYIYERMLDKNFLEVEMSIVEHS